MTESNGTEGRKLSFLKKLSLLLFPPRCVYCRSITERSSTPPALCPKCRGLYERERTAPCIECGNPADTCTCTFPYRGAITDYFCVAPYSKSQDTVSKKIVLTAKSKRLGYLFDFMADQIVGLYRLERHIEEKQKLGIPLIVTYVPRNPDTICEYGFDQAKELAERVAKRFGLECIAALRHKRGVSAQKEMNLAMRHENAENSYCEGKDISLVRWCNIIIIDDLITTGATVSACSSILRRNGAVKITAVTFAKNTRTDLR